ncbi:MAG: hypothetical protein ACXVAM_16325 [Vulcanimicrobiaceae bacterium]
MTEGCAYAIPTSEKTIFAGTTAKTGIGEDVDVGAVVGAAVAPEVGNGVGNGVDVSDGVGVAAGVGVGSGIGVGAGVGGGGAGGIDAMVTAALATVKTHGSVRESECEPTANVRMTAFCAGLGQGGSDATSCGLRGSNAPRG